jgi:3-oxoacyl-[acyl-carrier-protein] synthase II
MTRRVAVTGLGVVTAFGCDGQSLWDALRAGRSAARPVDGLDGASSVGAPVTGFSAAAHIDAKSLRLMAPAVSFGVAAAALAASDSGVDFAGLDHARLGAFVGSRGHSSDREDLVAAVERSTRDGVFRLDLFGAEGLPLVNPMWLLKGLANNVLYFVSLKFNAQGANNNLSMGGVASTMAIGEAFHAIQRGSIDVAFAGGYDSMLDQDRLELFGASGLVTRSTDPGTAGRPFDRRRDGFLPGEGAGFLILETVESAVGRGARIHGEVLGYGSAGGFEGALRAALADAGGVVPDAVFAHGLATPASDADETRAIKAVLGLRAAGTPVPAVKSMLGNTLAASGAVEAAAALFAMRDGLLPPTIHLTEPDPSCDLDYVAGSCARPAPLGIIALDNANLAGAHAALVLGRFA